MPTELASEIKGEIASLKNKLRELHGRHIQGLPTHAIRADHMSQKLELETEIAQLEASILRPLDPQKEETSQLLAEFRDLRNRHGAGPFSAWPPDAFARFHEISTRLEQLRA